ncbi:MAG: ATP-binding protein [Gemmatimonadaceae bacterium]
MPHRLSAEIAVVDRSVCDACGLCMPLCPPAAIHMRRDGLLVDDRVCTGCQKCIAPCPVAALTMAARSPVSPPPLSPLVA